MSQKSKAKAKGKYQEKQWYEVFAPVSFNNEKIGEIIGLENTIMDRTVESLLYDFTDDYDHINCKLRFKIIKVNSQSNQCETTLVGHQYTNDFVRSLVGKGATKVTSINNYTTKDDYTYRITTVCVTIRRARSSQQVVIRKIMREVLKRFASELDHNKFVRGMIFGEFQNQIKRIAKTIYPLFSSTIIKSKLVSMPEGGVDKEVKDEDFEVVELEIDRTRKSEIRRSERINVKKYAYQKTEGSKDKEEEEEEEEEDEE
ncbi:MAG: 30S ribosomal protein S3Ae [Promethearchaeota archaeon]|nr:MAG: 30S ribosomal protein S3Ae [Candidatus Lokiarchaeota archaeon]